MTLQIVEDIDSHFYNIETVYKGIVDCAILYAEREILSKQNDFMVKLYVQIANNSIVRLQNMVHKIDVRRDKIKLLTAEDVMKRAQDNIDTITKDMNA